MNEIGKTEPQDHWDDEDFLNEMQSRADDYESGSVKGITLDEFKAKIRGRHNDQPSEN